MRLGQGACGFGGLVSDAPGADQISCKARFAFDDKTIHMLYLEILLGKGRRARVGDVSELIHSHVCQQLLGRRGALLVHILIFLEEKEEEM
jgi:hypothetical protein